MGTMTILAGDIGGTKTNLALFETSGTLLKPQEEKSFPSAEFTGLESVIARFIDNRDLNVTSACFGIAGPVLNGVCRTPNLPWVVSESSLKKELRLDSVRLINDLEATAYGIPSLSANQLITLNEGEARDRGNIALIAAGTGLGEAALIWRTQHYHVVASEGGHADFAPRNELEIELLRYLLTLKSRVSYERVLSGPGLVNVYNFLRTRVLVDEPDWLVEAIATSDDKAMTISQNGLFGRSPLCVKALDLFVSVYGAQAGNLALTFKATGGVYVGGGIAPKIIDKLTDGTFMNALKDKGRLSPLVAAAPVHVIMNPKTALLGAANFAARQQEV
jgi:glucokinase